MPPIRPEYPKAQRHLSRRDPVMKQLIKQTGACTLQISTDYFALLVRSIISQQISTKASKTIGGRLLETLHPQGLIPKAIIKTTDEQLQKVGLSTAKRRYIRDLADKVHSGEVQLDSLTNLDDDAVIRQLLPVRGIGQWTAEMFLIFGLGRLDVLPFGDLGLRVGVQREYKLDEQPTLDELSKIAEPWQPYRSVATWYIWRSFGAVPQS